MLLLGFDIVAVSAFYASSFLAILGVAIIFWGAMLLYITPTKHVPIVMLYAEAEVSASNIERIINESGMSLTGIYLPPRNLKNVDSSLVIIPQKTKITLPSPDEITDSLTTNRSELEGVLIVPPGAALCRLFEHELNASFAKLDLKQLQVKLPKLLVEDMELAENAEIQIQGTTVILEISGSILDEICRQTDSQPRTHKQVGCLLSSAIACALAKAAGKPVIIQNETRNQETKTTHIEYQMLEGETMQLPPLTFPDALLTDTKVKSSVSGDSDLNISGIEIDPHALNYLKKNGDVFILTVAEIPQDSSCKIKGFYADAKVIIKFEEFVEVCKTHHDSQTNINNQRTEFTTKIFDVNTPANLKHYDLAFYVAKSGFSTVDDWVKTLKTDEIPECSTGHNKLFYLYHIQTIA
jgi:hypothetical protein